VANGYLNGKFESIPGNEDNTPTLSTKALFDPLISFEPGLNPAHLERDDELRNSDEPLQVLPEAYSPEWSREGRMYPDLVGYYLKNILGAPVSTPGDGVITDPSAGVIPTGAHRHVWTAPYGPSGASPLTSQFQAAYKDESTFFKLKGAASATLGIETPETGGARLTTGGPALYMSRIADPSLSPAYEALSVPPFQRGHLTIDTWLTGTATAEDFSVGVENPVETVRSLGISSAFPDVMEKGEGPIVVSGAIPKRHIDADDYDALLNATRFAVMVKWSSTAIIAAAYPYGLWLQGDGAQYTGGGPAALVNSRRIGATFDWKMTSDGAGASSTWTLVNATANYV
jgi:hypothetical protein